MPDKATQRLVDDAALYCRDAVPAIRDHDWQHAAFVLLNRCKVLDMALQSLTPGGSEYVGDPLRCVEHVQDQISKGRAARLEAARRARQADR